MAYGDHENLRIRTNLKNLPLDVIAGPIQKALNDERFTRKVNAEFLEYCKPYIPEDSGELYASAHINRSSITFWADHAHYMYMGKVYGPNYPITKGGQIIGWFSPPEEGSKHWTGDHIMYHRKALATDHWDKAMMRDRGEDFCYKVGQMLTEYFKSNSGEI